MSELVNAATVDAVESATPAVPHWHRLLPWVGLALAVVVWWIGAQLLILRTPIAESFAPWPALQALARLLASGELWPHVVTSMQRVAVGLGLAVASEIIARHGGRLEVDSVPGRTVFRALLPIERGDASQ